MEIENPAVLSPVAIEVCRDVPLEKAARQLLRPDLSAEEYVAILSDAGHMNDATRVLARMLPKRESVWWACQCARQAPLLDAPPEVKTALLLAEKWVAEMTEESRLAAGAAAEAAEIGTATGCAAMGAFVSSGSLTPPGAPPLAPPPGLTAQYVTASILITALSPNPEQAPAKYRTYLAQGIELFRATAAQPQGAG